MLLRRNNAIHRFLLLGSFLWMHSLAQEDGTTATTTNTTSFHCHICINGGMMGKPDGTVTTNNGQTTSCTNLEKYAGHLPERSCDNLQSLALMPCECPGFNVTETTDASVQSNDNVDGTEVEGTKECSICGEGEIMTNPAGLTLNALGRPTTCQALHDSRDGIPEGACATVQSFARKPCGCAIHDDSASANTTAIIGTSASCSICGEGGRMEKPEGIVVNSRGHQRRCSEVAATIDRIPEGTCGTLQDMAREPCGCTTSSLVFEEEVPFLCSICGDGSVMTNPQGTVSPRPGQTMRCGALQANAQSIPQNSCSTLQVLARDPCGCTPMTGSDVNTTTGGMEAIMFGKNNGPSQCQICGGGEMTIPMGIVTSRQGNTARCDILLQNSHTIPETACSNVQALAKDPCGCVVPANSSATNLTESVDRCSICGEGEMTNPSGIVTTPQGQSARCSALDANAISIPVERCRSIQELANEPCGCSLSIVIDETSGETLQVDDDTSICNVCGAGRRVSREGRMISTSLGMYTCVGAQTAGLMGNIPADHCDSVSISVEQECGCYAEGPTAAPSARPYLCQICGEGLSVTRPEVKLNVTDSSNTDSTCGQYEVAGLNGNVDEDQCRVLQQAAANACGCKEPRPVPTNAPTMYQCPICGIGRVIGLPDAEVVLPNTQRMSCTALQRRSELGVIQNPQCTQIQPFVKESCGCVDAAALEPTEAPTSFECNICGDGMRVTNPEGVVVIPTQPDRSCAQLMDAASAGNINPNQCRLLHPFVMTPCGCRDEISVAPSDSPSLYPTAPTVSSVPTSIMMRDDCFSDLGEIYAMERSVADTSVKRKYVLCPGRTFYMGVWTDDGEIKDGEPFLALRPNVVYQCGEDGSRLNDCVLKGGDFGLASYYGVFEGIYESVPGVVINGLTFESQNIFSVLLQSAGDITFVECAFKGNNNNVPVLIQWAGEGPEIFDVPIGRALQAERKARDLQSSGLKHVVTFQDCIFRDNFVDSSMSFPGVIENSFKSELILSNCLFQNNVYGDDQNPAAYGYAIRSFGPLFIDSTCFLENSFLNYGPVLVYGNQYSASNNYVESSQSDLLTCEFMALFNSQDDREDTPPICEMSDANVCAFSQAPTIAPSEGPTKDATYAPSSLATEPVAPVKQSTGVPGTSAFSAATESALSRTTSILLGIYLLVLAIHHQ